MNEILQQMIHTWSTGGWVMAALALLAFVTYTTAARLLSDLYYRGITRLTDTELARWIADPETVPGRLEPLVRHTQHQVGSLEELEGRFREVESSTLPAVDRRLAFLKILVVAAPLFGLLGTVLGMLLTFKAIGIGGSSTSDVIARGISEALVATQTGMMVALPGLAMAFLVKRWRDEYASFLARLEVVSLRHFRRRASAASDPLAVEPETRRRARRAASQSAAVDSSAEITATPPDAVPA